MSIASAIARLARLDRAFAYRTRRKRALAESIGLFDSRWYLDVNQDVARAGKDPFDHYMESGWREGRAPSRWFSANLFNEFSPDRGPGRNPVEECLRRVAREPGFRRELEARKGIQTATRREDRAFAVEFGLFDARWYRQAYPDIAAAGVDPWEHFRANGWREGRSPSAWFTASLCELLLPGFRGDENHLAQCLRQVDAFPDFWRELAARRGVVGYIPRDGFGVAATSERVEAEWRGLFEPDWYLSTHIDVSNAGLDPWVHYSETGWREGRAPSSWFDAKLYQSIVPAWSPDKNPVAHCLHAATLDPDIWRTIEKHRPPREYSCAARRLKDGLCVVGYLRSEIGLGQSARNLCHALDAERIPATFFNVLLPGRENDDEFATKCGPIMDRAANLFVIGLPAIAASRPRLAPGRRNILYPYWELAGIPDEWLAEIDHFDRIWAPSRFIANNLRGRTRLPIDYVPQPVIVPPAISWMLPDGAPLTVLCHFDFDSWPARKNPEAAIEAFRQAFPKGRDDARLVVKTRGADDRGTRVRLGEMALADARITLVDDTLDRSDMNALVGNCDIYLSLHRSEGFGFGPAEALAAGKAVVATNYSGTRDFINCDTGYPVACAMTPVREGEYVDWKDQVWAEPDIEDAARQLRAIDADRAAARRKGENGRRLIIDEFSPEAAGRRLRRLLVAEELLAYGPRARGNDEFR